MTQSTAAHNTCRVCEISEFARNHYFNGKLLVERDFTDEQRYYVDKLRHHNQALHGWGVVCGLKVKQHPNDACQHRYVLVESGSAVDCCGHDILVPEETYVDIQSLDPIKELKAKNDANAHTLQICLRYKECPTEEVPVLYDECGCDEIKCAPNRILESYEIGVLVDPPLPGADVVTGAPLGAFVATEKHGLTGFGRASAAGKVLAADPGRDVPAGTPAAAEPTRLFIIDTRYRSMKTIPLPDGARAAALCTDGNFVFVVVGFQTRLFKVEDASEIVPTDATKFQLPAAATGVLASVAGTGDNGFVVYSAGSGKAYRWKADATKGLVEASPDEVTLEANLSGVTASADAAVLYGVTTGGKVKQYTLAGGTKEYGTPTLPGALAALSLGATSKPLLAVASKTDKKVYLIDLSVASTELAATIDVGRQPLYLGATGSGDDVWLHVLGEENAHLHTQAVSLKPLTTTPAGQPLVAAPRLAADGARAIVLLFHDGQAGVIHPAALADSDCADHLWKQLEGCPACERPNCVVLATIANYQQDMALTNANIDNQLGRRVVASTATLQAWLQCLHLKGGIPGPKGDPGAPGADGVGLAGMDAQIVPCTAPPVASYDPVAHFLTLRVPRGCDGKDGTNGIGLHPDLPKIIDIGWTHEGQRNLNQFALTYASIYQEVAGGTALADVVKKRLTDRKDMPLFTLYFNKKMTGITRRTLSVAITAPFVTYDQRNQVYQLQGIYWPIELKIYGEVVGVDAALITPHTNETSPYAASFIPDQTFFTQGGSAAFPFLLLYFMTLLSTGAQVDKPTALTRLKGDFVYAPGANDAYSQFQVLDADNVGGRVGINEVRGGDIHGGENPSGDLAQGGDFEGWFFFTTGDNVNTAPLGFLTSVMNASGAGTMASAAMPTAIHAASEAALAETPGISSALAKKIVAERKRTPFASADDFRARLGLSDRAWSAIKDKILVL